MKIRNAGNLRVLAALILAIICCQALPNAIGQEFLQEISRPGAKFEEIEATFKKRWAGSDPVRGSGYKAYSRWRWMAQDRLREDGTVANISQATEDALVVYNEPEARAARAARVARDGGAVTSNWKPMGPSVYSRSAIGYNPGIGRLTCVVRHPRDSGKLFVGTPSSGIWASSDGGKSWSTTTDNLLNQTLLGVSGIVIHPTTPDINVRIHR